MLVLLVFFCLGIFLEDDVDDVSLDTIEAVPEADSSDVNDSLVGIGPKLALVGIGPTPGTGEPRGI